MYEILCRSAERPFALAQPAEASVPSAGLVLHMREHHSHLTKPARETFAVLGMPMMALHICCLRTIRRRAWTLIALSMVARIGSAMLAPHHFLRSVSAS